MKNIHILPTDKTSRIIKSQDNDFILLNTDAPNWLGINLKTTKQHIYITNDEEIKEDYVIAYEVVIKVMMFDKETLYFVNGTKAKREDCKKIILTTDQDLIKDGVQSIDDEFLEWFVKNPSCEKVELIPYLKDIINPLTNEKYPAVQHRHFDETKMIFTYHYQIIIPKEELIPPTKTTEDIKLIGEEPTLTITLNKEEARGLLNCIIRTSAKGKDLDIGEMIEDKLVEFLNS